MKYTYKCRCGTDIEAQLHNAGLPGTHRSMRCPCGVTTDFSDPEKPFSFPGEYVYDKVTGKMIKHESPDPAP